MAEALVGAVLQVLLEKLAHREVLEYFRHFKRMNQKVLEKWTRTLTAIEAVLSDAEEKQLTQKRVKLWLDDLRDLAYNIEDILDTFCIEMLTRRIERQHGSTSKSCISKLKSSYNLRSEIKKVSERLDEISSQQKQFGLKKLGPSVKQWKMPQTTSQLDGPVIGRDEEKAKMIDRLLAKAEHTSRFQNYEVVAIVGTGGLGKTTLAKHIFNNVVATEQFSPRGWVCVSHDFDLLRVTTAILQSVTSNHVRETKELNYVQEKLSKELSGKNFLIVLDDVWETCNYDQWITLQSSFRVGAAGSKIIVTTRHAEVAKMMGDTDLYNLGLVSDDDCWRIFQQHALLNDQPQIVELLKKKILAKCRGLPLAARTLGGLLRCKRVDDEWEEILDHKMWDLSDQTGILQALKLSYHYLPSNLKRCFTYCAILPYDYEFGKKQLILLWMAEGLIQQQPEEDKQMEDLGSDYFQELVSRSLFQKSREESSRYIMHDLITELARWAAGKTSSRLENMQNYGVNDSCLSEVHYSSYIPGEYDGVKKFEVYSQVTHLRTFLPLSHYVDYDHSLADKVTHDLLPGLQYLRVLSLNGYRTTKLPNTIGKLKHLRYLDLSHSMLTSLPESTSTLYNLQTLILEGCHKLKVLPTNMMNLINLRHLNNSNVPLLDKMPSQLGRLTNLRTLPHFIVGKGNSGSGLTELGTLSHLHGTLHISKLENVICVDDAKNAEVKRKEKLDALQLQWSCSNGAKEFAELVLDMLQPHQKLKELTISGYAGLKFSSWIGDFSFSNMVFVKLQDCDHCPFLPPFGQLPSLQQLHIKGMPALESVGLEFYGKGNPPFQALETLMFESLESWKEWSHCQQDEGIGKFPCLKMLAIMHCPKLEGSLPEKLDSLENMKIYGCEELVVSIANYTHLHESDIRKCKAVRHTSRLTSPVHFDLLETVRLSNISELRFQSEALMKSVKSLTITGCEELTSSSLNAVRLLQHSASLVHLDIEDNSALVEKLGNEAEQLLQLQMLDCKLQNLSLYKCENLLKLPEGLHHLKFLRELSIYNCSSLVSFPDIGLPPSLEVIDIRWCISLLYFARCQIPPSLRRLQIRGCDNMKSLIEKEVVDNHYPEALEYLIIRSCPSLVYILCKGKLSRTLKDIHIWNCEQLELITTRSFDDTYQLEHIKISDCPKLKSLPDGMCHLNTLESIDTWRCPSLVSLPIRSLQPRKIDIYNCEKLKLADLLRDLQHNKNLEELNIEYCECMTSAYSFPPNLTSLSIRNIKNCMALLGSQGLHRLTSLRILHIEGGDDPALVSFPPAEKETEMLLPKSIVKLTVRGFPNLKKLSKGFQFLACLEQLFIYNCPKLASIPEEGLPLSLKQFYVRESPLLEKRCKERSRSKLANIPCVIFDGCSL